MTVPGATAIEGAMATGAGGSICRVAAAIFAGADWALRTAGPTPDVAGAGPVGQRDGGLRA